MCAVFVCAAPDHATPRDSSPLLLPSLYTFPRDDSSRTGQGTWPSSRGAGWGGLPDERDVCEPGRQGYGPRSFVKRLGNYCPAYLGFPAPIPEGSPGMYPGNPGRLAPRHATVRLQLGPPHYVCPRSAVMFRRGSRWLGPDRPLSAAWEVGNTPFSRLHVGK